MRNPHENPPDTSMRDATVPVPLRRELAAAFRGPGRPGGSQAGSSGCESARLVRPLPRTASGHSGQSGDRSTPHALDAAARAADVATVARTSGCQKAHKMGPTRTTTRGQTLTRGVEDKAADILALARSLVHENDATLGRSKSTLRKSMRKTQTTRAATTSPSSKLRTTRWKSRTMQKLANGRTPELDFGPTKDELSNFDNDGQLMSIKDHCAVPPPEPRVPVIEPPSDVEALRRDYDARFSGLHAYGPTGATRLEELVEAALAASERAVAAYKAEKRAAHRSSSQIVPRATTCAALLASSGRVHVACAVRSNTDAALSVSAERAVVLRAVADGDRKFIGLVVADANSEELPVPDGAARQVLAEYGDFPVYLVNRDLRARRVTTHELFPSFACVEITPSLFDKLLSDVHAGCGSRPATRTRTRLWRRRCRRRPAKP
jgi:cytidine deaminase